MAVLKLVNNVKLIGNVGQVPVLETSENSKKYLSFSLATNEGYKKEGERIEKTVWHNCICYGKTAELYATLLPKGSHVALEGNIAYNEYSHESGVKMTSTSINVDSILLLGKKESES